MPIFARPRVAPAMCVPNVERRLRWAPTTITETRPSMPCKPPQLRPLDTAESDESMARLLYDARARGFAIREADCA
jgi:hypothetical protein